ncbi:MAG: hypothetical protein ACFHU9_06990 [Fluviicola sp.]
MKWIGERISFVEDKNRTTIVIEPVNAGWVRSAMGAWVFMWFAIGISVIINYNSLGLDENQAVFIWVFMAFWAYYAVRVTRSWLWLMWGKELIKIDEVAMTYKRSIKKYGKANPYLLENIQKMRVSTPKENSVQAAWEKSPWVVGGERLEFDYMGRLVRFGRKLNEKDAEMLFRYITKRIEQQIRKNKKNQAKAEKI